MENQLQISNLINGSFLSEISNIQDTCSQMEVDYDIETVHDEIFEPSFNESVVHLKVKYSLIC